MMLYDGGRPRAGGVAQPRGYEFDFARGYRVRFAARRIKPTKGRPYGVKYSLTLHDPAGRRIYGIDNAHAPRRQAVFDHHHGV